MGDCKVVFFWTKSKAHNKSLWYSGPLISISTFIFSILHIFQIYYKIYVPCISFVFKVCENASFCFLFLQKHPVLAHFEETCTTHSKTAARQRTSVEDRGREQEGKPHSSSTHSRSGDLI